MTLFDIHLRRGPLTNVHLFFHPRGNCWSPWRLSKRTAYSGRLTYHTWWRFTLVTERFTR